LGLSYSDLIAEGNVGLIKSMDKFDITKGYKTITYSTWWIRQTIMEAIKKRNGLEGEELPCDSEQQDFLDDDSVSYNPPSYSDEFIAFDDNIAFQAEEEKKAVELLLGVLSDREKFIVSNYYGLTCDKPKTLEEIGKEIGLTKERVRQINEKALKKLRTEALNKCITSDIYK
jgi:RNA polymerase sigma factor (sigma-70 family)